ncbi:alpha/beta hydrolase, partial [Myxococcota bacterium]|nr:alpha/beta hydrolase [Myxococcota bacterium]
MSASRALLFVAALAAVAPSLAPAVAHALAQTGGAAVEDDPPPADDWGAEGEGADETPPSEDPVRETPP